MGLSGLGYNGHVFWDTELMDVPVYLVLHPEIAVDDGLSFRTLRNGKTQCVLTWVIKAQCIHGKVPAPEWKKRLFGHCRPF